MIQSKYVSLVWLKREGFAFPELIKYHRLKKLVEMKSTYYNNLVKVFYAITHIYGDTGFLCTEVKGQQIMMTQMVWLDIDGLSSKEVMAYQLGLKEARFAFNKVEKYKPTMKTPFYLCCCYKSKRKEMFWYWTVDA